MGNLLNVKELSYKYKNDFIIENLSFSIDKKKIYTFLGSNNSGKTTLIKIMSGILHYNYTFSFNGVTNSNNYSKDYLSDINFLIPYKKLRESKKTVLSFLKKWASIYGYNKRKLENLMQCNDIVNLKNTKIIDLDDYDFFKIILNALMLKKPKVIFFDDIFDFISFNDYCKMIEYLKTLQESTDLTIVFTSKMLDRCLNSDKIFFLCNGKIKFEGEVSKILDHDNILAREGIVISPMLDLSLKLKFYELCDTVEMNPRKMVDKLWK